MPKEAKARIKINKLLEESGWRFFDDKNGAHNIEVEDNADLSNLGDDFEHSKTGFLDYLLLDTRGFPLAVLEAKSESKSPFDGEYKAEQYAKAKRCRFIILSNGDKHFFWDLNQKTLGDRYNPLAVFIDAVSIVFLSKTAP